MSQNTRRDPRAKVLSMTVRYRSATLGEFIEHHSYDVSRGGMFIKTPSPFPPGTLLKFEVKIAGEQRVMQGVGRVVWKRDRPSDETGEPAGMGIKFIKIDDSSKSVIEKLVEARGPGSGAFEASPDSAAAPGNMFPASKAEPPAPEDRTVMKPAAELLNEALSKTGQSPITKETAREPGDGAEEPPLSAKAAPGEETLPPSAVPATLAPSTAAPSTLQESQPLAGERKTVSKEERRSSTAEGTRARGASASSAGGARPKEEEGSGGRAFALLVVAALVMAGIFLLTKKSSEPALEEPPERTEAPPLATPSGVIVPETAPTTELVGSVLVDDPSAVPSAPVVDVVPSATASAPLASASASAAPVPKPAPKPKPRPKPVVVPPPAAPLEGPADAPTSPPAPAAPPDPEPN